MSDFRAKINEMIKMLGTPENVAATLGVSLGSIINWSNGRTDPIYSLRKQINRKYNIVKARWDKQVKGVI